MEDQFKFTLSNDIVENINTFSTILKKDANTILNEALEQYFENEQKNCLKKILKMKMR